MGQDNHSVPHTCSCRDCMTPALWSCREHPAAQLLWLWASDTHSLQAQGVGKAVVLVWHSRDCQHSKWVGEHWSVTAGLQKAPGTAAGAIQQWGGQLLQVPPPCNPRGVEVVSALPQDVCSLPLQGSGVSNPGAIQRALGLSTLMDPLTHSVTAGLLRAPCAVSGWVTSTPCRHANCY